MTLITLLRELYRPRKKIIKGQWLQNIGVYIFIVWKFSQFEDEVAVIIRTQVIELRRLGDTECNSIWFSTFNKIDQDPGLTAYCKGDNTYLGSLCEHSHNSVRCLTDGSISTRRTRCSSIPWVGVQANAIAHRIAESLKTNNRIEYSCFKTYQNYSTAWMNKEIHILRH